MDQMPARCALVKRGWSPGQGQAASGDHPVRAAPPGIAGHTRPRPGPGTAGGNRPVVTPPPRLEYSWNLRQLMAARNLWKATQLVPLLRDRGIALSASQIRRLVTGKPERLSLAVLAALCDILGCTRGDLITVQPAAARRYRTVSPPPGPAAVLPSSVRLTRCRARPWIRSSRPYSSLSSRTEKIMLVWPWPDAIAASPNRPATSGPHSPRRMSWYR